MRVKSKEKNIIALNRKAHRDYSIIESWEVGMVLKGTEVKSSRSGKVNLRDSFCRVENGELFAHNIHISLYEKSREKTYDPLRKRKLLMHRKQINKIFGMVKEKGFTIIPLEMYFSRGIAKVLVALGKGKRSYDKREHLRKKQIQRDVARAQKEH